VARVPAWLGHCQKASSDAGYRGRGRWKGTEALQRCYLHADEETMLTVVMSGTQLREVKKA
jgi:hypothetical protein